MPADIPRGDVGGKVSVPIVGPVQGRLNLLWKDMVRQCSIPLDVPELSSMDSVVDGSLTHQSPLVEWLTFQAYRIKQESNHRSVPLGITMVLLK